LFFHFVSVVFILFFNARIAVRSLLNGHLLHVDKVWSNQTERALGFFILGKTFKKSNVRCSILLGHLKVAIAGNIVCAFADATAGSHVTIHSKILTNGRRQFG